MSNPTTSPTVANAATVQMPPAAASDLMLLGVFGPETDLRALVRLPGGRLRKVSRGARLAQGRILAIDTQGLILERKGQARRIPVAGD